MPAAAPPVTAPVVRSLSDDVDFIEYPSTFPLSHRPVYFWDARPRVFVDFRMTAADEAIWISRIDAIIRSRAVELGRSGIIPSTSYARAKRIMQLSRFRDRMLLNDSSDELSATVKEFKRRAGKGAVLVSPSITTGVNFPDDECRFILWPKLPYPDMRGAVMARRQREDPEQRNFLMVKTLVQGCGRGNRHIADWCESVIVDSHASHALKWLSQFAPRYFQEAVRTTTTMPQPLELAA